MAAMMTKQSFVAETAKNGYIAANCVKEEIGNGDTKKSVLEYQTKAYRKMVTSAI